MLQYDINENDVKPTGPKRNILKRYAISMIISFFMKIMLIDFFVSFQTIPHEYVSKTVQADALLTLRKTLKKGGTTLSLNDFIVKAAALTLRTVPAINVQWSPEKECAISLSTIDISVAVATPTGLITPIVTGADILGVREISYRIKNLSNRARENKLQPHEFQGGSFTISNLGMFGSVDNFTAIINPPQSAILTIGGSRIEINNEMKPETRFTSTLCFDARAISPLSARAFIEQFSLFISDPDCMIVELEDSRLDFDIARLL
uniref:2-oxoacid_dh domain-containing protein n=1 Tax=Heterorhabditis bacteriophora TaxID=37862 RepID=A0A1I7X7K8_HETBA